MKRIVVTFLVFAVSFSIKSQTLPLADYGWLPIDATGDVVARHETAFIEYNTKFYLIGGRGINPVNVFDPKTNHWETKGKSPMEIHHFQAVVYGDVIYLIGAMTGKYPKETPLQNIWMYYPETDKWVKGAEIPEARRRGGAGAVVYNDKIYLACGIKFGHTSGTTNYFDSYDLKTGKWEILTDAPHIRDHFPAIVADNKMYCIGGRNTSVHNPDNFPAFFDATEPEIDYYDFLEGKWYTAKEPLPVPTAAGGLVKIEDYLLYIGGEGILNKAYDTTQCFDLKTAQWSQLAPMSTGRHGSGAVLYDNKIFIAAGSPKKGGGNLSTIEVFSLNHN
jgi:N-acetylneuraminic acid mutarotase